MIYAILVNQMGDEIRIVDIDVGDPSNPDWAEAIRLASELLAARLELAAGGGDAVVAAYQALVRWAVDEQPGEVAVNRLLSVIEALVRYGECGLGVTAEAANDPTFFDAGPLGSGTTAMDVLDRFTREVETVEGEEFRIS